MNSHACDSIVRRDVVSEYGVVLVMVTCAHGRTVIEGPPVSERGWAPSPNREARCSQCGRVGIPAGRRVHPECLKATAERRGHRAKT